MAITPRGKIERTKGPRLGYSLALEPQIEILAWCPDDEAKVPPEQVHFVVSWPVGLDFPPLVIRFMSPDTLGFFIEELTRFRRFVWPDCKKVEGEK